MVSIFEESERQIKKPKNRSASRGDGKDKGKRRRQGEAGGHWQSVFNRTVVDVRLKPHWGQVELTLGPRS